MSATALDYRSFLRAELARRNTINPSYSLRAFARALSLAPGALSEILNGKRTLGPKKAQEIVKKLALAPEERSIFLGSLERKVVDAGIPRSVLEKNEEGQPGDYEVGGFIDAETWGLCADWLIWAIKSKLDFAPRHYDLGHYARLFGVSEDKVSHAVEILAKKGFVKIHENGEIERVDRNTSVKTPHLADALRRINRDILIKALDSIEEFTPKERIIGNRIFCANSRKIKEAEEKIEKFRKELMEFLQQGELDTCYCISTTLFPLEKK